MHASGVLKSKNLVSQDGRTDERCLPLTKILSISALGRAGVIKEQKIPVDHIALTIAADL